MDLFCKTLKPVAQVLENAGIKKDEVNKVSSNISGLQLRILAIVTLVARSSYLARKLGAV